MLRLIVVLLLLANGAYFAWVRGHLALFGLAPVAQTEPARMQAQIKPELVQLVKPPNSQSAGNTPTLAPAVPPAAVPTGSASAAQSATASAPAPKSAECLQSPLLDARLTQAVRTAAAALPSGSWALESASEPARWIVYMGKYTAADVLAKKRAELRQLDVTIVPLQNPNLEPGISLGGFATQGEANRELTELNKRGVRTAKVLQEKAAATGQVLRLPAVDDALRGQLGSLRTALGNAALRTCKAA
jgi:hypothetical protein